MRTKTWSSLEGDRMWYKRKCRKQGSCSHRIRTEHLAHTETHDMPNIWRKRREDLHTLSKKKTPNPPKKKNPARISKKKKQRENPSQSNNLKYGHRTATFFYRNNIDRENETEKGKPNSIPQQLRSLHTCLLMHRDHEENAQRKPPNLHTRNERSTS